VVAKDGWTMWPVRLEKGLSVASVCPIFMAAHLCDWSTFIFAFVSLVFKMFCLFTKQDLSTGGICEYVTIVEFTCEAAVTVDSPFSSWSPPVAQASDLIGVCGHSHRLHSTRYFMACVHVCVPHLGSPVCVPFCLFPLRSMAGTFLS
jgi:hypothetical protein